jgi:hypothetical protein
MTQPAVALRADMDARRSTLVRCTPAATVHTWRC